MFAFEKDGYSREEVDAYIAKLKTELMQKKLSLLDSEKKVLDLKQQRDEVESKEKNILKALKTLERAQILQEEGSKNLNALKTEQSRLIYDTVHELISYLLTRHPELKNDVEITNRISKLDDMVESSRYVSSKTQPINTDNDSMRALINKMQEYRRQKEEVKTVKIERNNIHLYDTASNVDEFLAKKPENNELYKNIDIQSSGFDLKEAVNPKDDLDEIMKAFDFFNDEE